MPRAAVWPPRGPPPGRRWPLPRVFHGEWGHHEFDADWARSAEARYVGLGGPGAWTGLCRFEPHRRYLGGPGFHAGSRSPDAVRRLVLGALVRPGLGPVTIETWGEPPDLDLELGCAVEEECGGWERALPS